MFLIKKDQKFYIKNLIYLIYFFCWFSISTNFEDLKIFSNDKLNFNHIINFTRQFLVIVSVLFLFVLGIKIIIKKEITKPKKIFHYLLFLIYLILQIPGLIISENNIINIGFTISSICILLLFIISEIYMNQNERKIFFQISCLFLISVFIFTFFPDFVSFINGKNSLYGYYSNSLFFFDKLSPRSSGLSRTVLILLIFLSIFFNQNTNFKRYIFNFVSIFFISIILLLQSRTIIFLTLLYLIFYIVIQKNYSLKFLIREIIKFVIIPIIISILFTNLNYYQLSNKENFSKNLLNNFFLNTDSFNEIKLKTRPIDNFSSGRFEDWNEITSKIDRKFIIGFGAQGDRFLINQTASSGILYALTSSGFVGLFFYLCFSLIVFFKTLRSFFFSKVFDKKEIMINCCIIIILMRSILESSYAVFGIDLIILMTCINYSAKTFK